jgi:hypothetical protein
MMISDVHLIVGVTIIVAGVAGRTAQVVAVAVAAEAVVDQDQDQADQEASTSKTIRRQVQHRLT